MRDASLDVDAIRIFLHVLGISVWLGGQIVVAAIVPMVRRSHSDALQTIAKGFGRIGWPFFAIAVVTGIWNMLAVDADETSGGWNAVLGIKVLRFLPSSLANAAIDPHHAVTAKSS